MTDTFSKQDGSTHFGYAEVPLSQKQHLVDDVFHKVAQRYDVMNDLMSA
jgi:demethylmenaquinone methyltransferase/2-methoxy-6-polyprenyl-1,4-benzoquinol methylase